DATAAGALRNRLAQAGIGGTILAENATSAAAVIDKEPPDLVMLDWDLPDVVSMNLIGRIRRAETPRLIIFSLRAEEEQIITGFEMGADDYVVKPYSIAEVVARVRAVLRMSSKNHGSTPVLRFNSLEMDTDNRSVTAGGHFVGLRT